MKWKGLLSTWGLLTNWRTRDEDTVCGTGEQSRWHDEGSALRQWFWTQKRQHAQLGPGSHILQKAEPCWFCLRNLSRLKVKSLLGWWKLPQMATQCWLQNQVTHTEGIKHGHSYHRLRPPISLTHVLSCSFKQSIFAIAILVFFHRIYGVKMTETACSMANILWMTTVC